MIFPSCRENLLSCMKIVFLSFLFVLLPLSCQKSEGLGGTGSISGTITEQFYNDDFSLLIYEKPAVDEEVYIVFGKSEELGNRVRTNQLGQFRFKFLYPGDYQVYFISGDSTSALNMDVATSPVSARTNSMRSADASSPVSMGRRLPRSLSGSSIV